MRAPRDIGLLADQFIVVYLLQRIRARLEITIQILVYGVQKHYERLAPHFRETELSAAQQALEDVGSRKRSKRVLAWQLIDDN